MTGVFIPCGRLRAKRNRILILTRHVESCCECCEVGAGRSRLFYRSRLKGNGNGEFMFSENRKKRFFQIDYKNQICRVMLFFSQTWNYTENKASFCTVVVVIFMSGAGDDFFP